MVLMQILATAHAASAQQLPSMDMKLTTDTSIDKPAYVQQVPASGLPMLEVSEPAGKLVFAQQDSMPQIMLLTLSSHGDVIAGSKATGFSLPGNQNKKVVNQVLAIATHPTMPVLYVWQDTGTNPSAIVAPKNEKAKQYNHLLIYDISTDPPQLLMSACNGKDFMVGRSTGMLTLGNNGRRLFVPNMRYDVTRSYGVAIGYYELDGKGLPILTGKEPEADPLSVSGSPDQDETTGNESSESTSTEAATQALTEAPTETANEKVTTGRGGGLTMLHLSNVGSKYHPSRAFYIDDAHTLLLTGTYLATYDTSNRTGRLAAVNIPNANLRYPRMTTHNALGMAYFNYIGSSHVAAWALFNGYPSLVPQRVDVTPLVINSPVVHLTKHQKLALGSNNKVLLLSLDKQGFIQPAIEQFKIDVTSVSLMVYSPKFDRLYLGTDARLEVKP